MGTHANTAFTLRLLLEYARASGEKELEATVVKQAEADRRAAVLRAQGLQEAAILEAEGRKQAQIATAEAEAQKLQREGQGRASAVEAEGKAEAEKIRAVGLAEAERLEATGLAQAKAIEAQGLAEAAAIKEKAAAWREFNDAARLQTILEKLPAIIESSAPVFQAVAEPLGKIDKVVMIDQGGNGRQICNARKPKCLECVLADICPSFDQFN